MIKLIDYLAYRFIILFKQSKASVVMVMISSYFIILYMFTEYERINNTVLPYYFDLILVGVYIVFHLRVKKVFKKLDELSDKRRE